MSRAKKRFLVFFGLQLCKCNHTCYAVLPADAALGGRDKVKSYFNTCGFFWQAFVTQKQQLAEIQSPANARSVRLK